MRIIDKNYDFYDYLQGIYPDRTVTFDRTKSFTLSKNTILSGLDVTSFRNRVGHTSYLLLQVCNRFWLFEVTTTKTNEYDRAVDCDIALMTTWTNYTADRQLFSLNYIKLKGDYWYALYDAKTAERRQSIISDAINTNNYEKVYNLDSYSKWQNGGYVVVKNIPLLKACGLADFIEPLDIYLAIEEYFSLEREASERRESIGLTNDDKITNHGFDTKISFRGTSKKKKKK